MRKYRLDKLLVDKGFAGTRQQAQDLIAEGQILVNGMPAVKPGSSFPPNCNIVLQGKKNPYVSRGGVKLEAGLVHFGINPQDFICADIGASTGGFTDCLLQHGAQKVYAVDVGYGQLDWKIRNDPRVVVMERMNARNLRPTDISDPLDLAVADASFISLKLLLPPLLPLFISDIAILALIKPQFEAGKERVGKGGVIRDPDTHTLVIEEILAFTSSLSLKSHGTVLSPLRGPKGNKEFLVYLTS
ncbi:TlyA family RNA methyltransferase [Thermodesulfobacteriota bacterium]